MVEVGHFVLDPLQEHRVCFSEERPVIVVTEHRQPKEVNKEPGRFVAVFHNECVKFCLGIHEGIIWAKVDEELLDEQFVVFEPGWLIIWVSRNGSK